jgi:hypothetical protein
MRKSVSPARGFEQEPRTTLGFIDPDFDETGCDITMFVTHVVRFKLRFNWIKSSGKTSIGTQDLRVHPSAVRTGQERHDTCNVFRLA